MFCFVWVCVCLNCCVWFVVCIALLCVVCCRALFASIELRVLFEVCCCCCVVSCYCDGVVVFRFVRVCVVLVGFVLLCYGV